MTESNSLVKYKQCCYCKLTKVIDIKSAPLWKSLLLHRGNNLASIKRKCLSHVSVGDTQQSMNMKKAILKFFLGFTKKCQTNV